jgi:hypothetical protein
MPGKVKTGTNFKQFLTQAILKYFHFVLLLKNKPEEKDEFL